MKQVRINDSSVKIVEATQKEYAKRYGTALTFPQAVDFVVHSYTKLLAVSKSKFHGPFYKEKRKNA